VPGSLSLLSFGPEGWGDEIAAGVLVTVGLAVATLPFGLALGFVLALARRSGAWFWRDGAAVFTTVFRGLPELLTLFLVYVGFERLLQGLFGEVMLNPFLAGMIALGFVFGAFSSEVFLAAFNGIGKGQFEGAAALGLRHGAAYRLVILPQLVRLALPGLSNLWLILLKDTSLVSVIGISDIMRNATIAARVAKEPFLFFGTALLLYLALSIVSSFGIRAVERWAGRGVGAAGFAK